MEVFVMPVKFPARLGLIAAAAVLCLALAPAAFAGKGGGAGAAGGSNISAPILVSDVAGDGALNHGDTVVFNVSPSISQPFVNVKCAQNGVTVYNAWLGYFDGALNTNRDFGLASGAWQSGAADCVANVDVYSHGKWVVLGSAGFHVDA
jgi:hypothetical protein